jgi:hypothetical protein
MTAMFSALVPTGTIPARSLTIHKADACTVSFDGYGSAAISGPRQAELAVMISALPMVLRSLAKVCGMLRDRDGAASPYVAELEATLMEAGINPDAPTEEEQPMSTITPALPVERFAVLLANIADTLDGLLADKKGLHSTPNAIRDALADISTTIRRTLRENSAAGTNAEEVAE